MTEEALKNLLARYKQGEISEEEAVASIRDLPFEEMGFAAVDHHRELRQGFPEVIYAAGKTKEQVLKIMTSLRAKTGSSIMATRADGEKYAYVKASLPEAKYQEAARIIYIEGEKPAEGNAGRYVLILTAGTSDIPVAEEARLTAHLWGSEVHTCYDCGVAGIHRLFAHLDEIKKANVIVVIAGMEGALASVVGGLTDKPVIAVPTSIGYGASFQGLSALLSMLNSCASGVSVVNIDNGFGAGVLAAKINRMR